MTVRGLASLNRKLKRLPDKAEAAIRAQIAKSAGGIVAMAQNLVPKQSRALHDSIGWRWGAAPKGSRVLGSVKGGDALTATIFAGNDKAFYARWVEFGTVKASAQPFFFPAYRAHAKKAKAAIKRAINKAARAEAGL